MAPDLGGALAAQIVAPTLEDSEGEFRTDSCRHHGQVLAGQLVLKRLGGGGHHHLLAGQGGRDQIGQGLTRSRSRLHHQMTSGTECPAHRAGHLCLTFPCLAAPGKRGGHQGKCRPHHIDHSATLLGGFSSRFGPAHMKLG